MKIDSNQKLLILAQEVRPIDKYTSLHVHTEREGEAGLQLAMKLIEYIKFTVITK